MPMPRLLAPVLMTAALAAHATPVTYAIDPTHTYPSFEADHMGGVSVWRGKFNKTSGQVVWDRTTGQGTVDLTVDMNSVDYGLDIMNDKARSPELFDTAKYPTAVYKGRIEADAKGLPTKVTGALTLHGVTRPVELQLNSFKCIPHPMLKRELCGADAITTIQRDAFGIDAGKPWGFKMDVTLRIQVEAVATE